MVSEYQPLYLKYRPQALKDLVGQKSVFSTLKNAIEHDRIAHAYLFTGPRGCGKTSSARILAKSLNCQAGPTADPCLSCTSCLEIKQVNSPSVIEIDAASNNSVDDARILIERAPLVSAGGRFKLYIIDECHMLTKEAFNALLKTIEEPPPNVIFVLATTEEHKVPPTIISRCQRLMFRLINHKELSAYLKEIAKLENINIDDQAIELIARRSGGGLRDALGLLDQASLLSADDRAVQLTDLLTLLGSVQEDVLTGISRSVIERDGNALLTFTQQLLTEGREPALIALELAKHFLNLAKAKYIKKGEGDCESLVLGSPQYIEAIIDQAQLFDQVELAQMVEQIDRLEQSCRRSTQAALTLEIGLLSLCHRLEITELRELKSRIDELEASLRGDEPQRARSSTKAPPAAPQRIAPRTIPEAEPPRKIAAEHPEPSAARQEQTAAAPLMTEPQAREIGALEKQDVFSLRLDYDEHRDESLRSDKAVGSDGANRGDAARADHAAAQSEPSAVSDGAARYDATDKSDAAGAAIESEGAPVGEAGFIEIDEFWSAVLDDLNERHRPTFSLVSTHVTPLSLAEDEVVVGTKSDMFQKMIEAKVDHLKAAAKAALGRSVHVKVRVMPPSESKSGAQAKRKPGADASRLAPEGTASLQAAPQSPGKTGKRASESAAEGEPEDEAGLETGPQKRKIDEPEAKSGLVQEAYRLFEGPGSRQFGD